MEQTLTAAAVHVEEACGKLDGLTAFLGTVRQQLYSRGWPRIENSLHGSNVQATLSYGRAIVTIPTRHAPGSLELPSIWRFERQPP